MPGKRAPRDPIAAYQRSVTAGRRVGRNAKCVCGEDRPQTLIAGSRPVTCIECKRLKEGKTIMDKHHVAGKSNSPVTIPIPANDHKAELSEAQYDWPKATLENSAGSPLRCAAGSIRGGTDTIRYLLQNVLGWPPDFLELLDQHLSETIGPNWWVGTPVEKFALRRSRNA